MKGQMKNKDMKDKHKKEDLETTKLEIHEYVFDGQTPNKHASKEEWIEYYRERNNRNFNETTKLYDKVVQFPYPNVALKTVRDHAIDTLILALIVGNRVSEVNVNLEKVPTTDIIDLNRETSDILKKQLLKDTLQMSKLELSKEKT